MENLKRAIEESFPIVEINRLAVPERNAFKPIYQMHKWFARRASCVFRAILLGAMKPAGTDIMDEFYKDHTHDPDTNGVRILDPFMGGGTTVVEALRLGCHVTGIDLNPVAWFIVKTEVEPVNIEDLKAAFKRLEKRPTSTGKTLKEELLNHYKTECPCCGAGRECIYARMDPHPAFRIVTFLSRVVRGRGQLSTIVSDPIEEKECDHPAAVLSSSQVNALAVSVFLALNIGVLKPPLSVAILDDPLQSLDEINLLGLVDLLRRAKDRRQLFVSTHDARFGNLLSRKLRPSNEKERTIVIELDAWSRQGPLVKTREVKNDPVPLRLVASGTR